jgi:hypothetical protein
MSVTLFDRRIRNVRDLPCLLYCQIRPVHEAYHVCHIVELNSCTKDLSCTYVGGGEGGGPYGVTSPPSFGMERVFKVVPMP